MTDALIGHQYEIRQIAVSPDGRHMASVGGDEVFIWDLGTGVRVTSFISPEGPIFGLWSVAYSGDGKQLVTGCGLKDVGSVRIWDIESHHQTSCPTEWDWASVNVDFSKTDNLVAAAFSEEEDIHIWNIDRGYEEKIFIGEGLALKVRFSPDGRRIAAGSGNGTVEVWNTSSGERLIDVSVHPGPVADLAYSSDGRLLITCGSDSAICLLDSDTGHLLARFKGDEEYFCVALSADNRHIASGTRSGNIGLWDTSDIGRHVRLGRHEAEVNSIIFLPGNMSVASASSDGTIRIWNYEHVED